MSGWEFWLYYPGYPRAGVSGLNPVVYRGRADCDGSAGACSEIDDSRAESEEISRVKRF